MANSEMVKLRENIEVFRFAPPVEGFLSCL